MRKMYNTHYNWTFFFCVHFGILMGGEYKKHCVCFHFVTLCSASFSMFLCCCCCCFTNLCFRLLIDHFHLKHARTHVLQYTVSDVLFSVAVLCNTSTISSFFSISLLSLLLLFALPAFLNWVFVSFASLWQITVLQFCFLFCIETISIKVHLSSIFFALNMRVWVCMFWFALHFV